MRYSCGLLALEIIHSFLHLPLLRGVKHTYIFLLRRSLLVTCHHRIDYGTRHTSK
jgi:hypothetical protein